MLPRAACLIALSLPKRGTLDLGRRLSPNRAAAVFRGDDRRRIQRDRLPLPGRALVAVVRGDDAGHVAATCRCARCRQVVEQVRASLRVATNVLPQTSQESRLMRCSARWRDRRSVALLVQTAVAQ